MTTSTNADRRRLFSSPGEQAAPLQPSSRLTTTGHRSRTATSVAAVPCCLCCGVTVSDICDTGAVLPSTRLHNTQHSPLRLVSLPPLICTASRLRVLVSPPQPPGVGRLFILCADHEFREEFGGADRPMTSSTREYIASHEGADSRPAMESRCAGVPIDCRSPRRPRAWAL